MVCVCVCVFEGVCKGVCLSGRIFEGVCMFARDSGVGVGVHRRIVLNISVIIFFNRCWLRVPGC